MRLTDLHALAQSGDFEAALAAAETFDGSDEEQLEARCVKAWCMSRLGDHSGALAEATAVLADGEKVLGLLHHVTLEALNDVARFSARCGDLQSSVAHGQSAHARRAEALGEHHPKTLTSLANLLRYRATLGEQVPASELEDLKTAWRSVDPGAANPAHLNAWALWSELSDDSSSASACLVRFSAVLGEDHPDTIRARVQLASLVSRGDSHA